MEPTTAAALIGVAGTGLQAYQGGRNIKKTHRYNVKMADYTFNKNLEMWKLQNQYNSPQAQMQRLQEAGLNPHLMYGKGTVGNAQTMPQYVAPQGDFRGQQNVIGSMAQAGLGAAAQAADVENKRIALRAAEIGIETQTLQNGLLELDNEFRKRVDPFRETKEATEATTALYNEQIKRIESGRYKYGVDGASTEYKILFEDLYQRYNEGQFTEQQLQKIISGMAISKIGYGVAKDVLGGALFAKFFTKQSTKSFQPSGYSKNFYRKGKETNLNDMYRGPRTKTINDMYK